MKLAFFDTKPYDKPAFDRYAAAAGIRIKYYETKLNEDTVDLASGADAVCVFVNDTVNAAVIDRLCALGVRTVALRCAGFNNVDIKHAAGCIRVVRVPAYSPYAVAEHAIALLLTSIRRIHKAYIRTRDFNFSLNGMTGFDLHGKTVGVIGTGRIGRVFIDICLGFGMKVLAYDKGQFRSHFRGRYPRSSDFHAQRHRLVAPGVFNRRSTGEYRRNDGGESGTHRKRHVRK